MYSLSLLSRVCLILVFYPAFTRGQESCALRPPPRIQTVIHEQVVSINTHISTNTTFYPIPEAAVTVTDAPTSIDEIITLSWSQTRPYTAFTETFDSITQTSTEASPITTPSSDSFFILVVQGFSQAHRRDDSSYFIGANGSATSDCSNLPVYTIQNGMLSATINGVAYYYSTDQGVAYAPLVPSITPGSITTTFYASNSGMLTWSNSEFWNGQAQFCAIANGTVYATFQESAVPDGCSYISLSLYASSCAAQPGSTGPTGEE